jgi:hypothetical protein
MMLASTSDEEQNCIVTTDALHCGLYGKHKFDKSNMFITEKLFGSRRTDEEDGTANGFFIQTQLLPLLIQLQKETRGRRFRVSTSL